MKVDAYRHIAIENYNEEDKSQLQNNILDRTNQKINNINLVELKTKGRTAVPP